MGCPSPQQLEHMLEEQLADREQEAVSLHVSLCPACQSALENLTSATESNVCLSAAHTRQASAAAKEPLTPFLARLKEMSAQAVLSAGQLGNASEMSARVQGARLPSSRPVVPEVPGYEILMELGRGGMGVVYKARQVALNRLVALKMILAGPHARPRELVRFRQEAESVARLLHNNIVQIFDIGEIDSVPYLVLEYVEGSNLVQRLRGDPQELKPAVRLIETLARTVHFAHQRGVVHRDLKPANVLLAQASSLFAEKEQEGPTSESGSGTPAYGQPKITDFGLAKRLDEEDEGTPSGDIVGTPSYMAPEQASGKSQLIGPATDVYALGAMLYEMFTGRPPFKGASALDTVVQVVYEEPVRPGRLRPRLPLDLETICLKCLNKEPARRYDSAAALADDLQRFLKGKPILARPVSPVERAVKWARRRPLTTALIAGLILCALLGFGGVTWQWREATRARDVILGEKREKELQTLQAEQARADAIGERRRAQIALYFSRIAQAQLQWRVNNVVGARESLAKCVPLPDQEDRRDWEWHYLRGLFHADLFTLFHSQAGVGGNAVFHPDGRTIASVSGGHPIDDSAHPGEVRFWDARTGALLRTLPAPGTAHRLVFRPDGLRLALATTDGSIRVWETATGKEVLRTPPDGRMIPSMAFSPGGRWLASASWDQTVKIFDARTGRILHILQGHAGPVQSVAFHPDGKRLASGDGDATVKVWDIATGQDILTLRGHKSPVYGVAFSPDGALLVSGSSNGNLKIWEMATGRAIQSLTSQSGAVFGNCFSPDGRYLAYCGGDATVRVWDLETGVARMTLRGHTASVESVQFSPDGQRLVSSSPAEATVKVWDLTRHPEQGTFARVRGRAGEQIKLRDLTARADAVTSASTGPDLEALAFHRDGKHLVSVAVGGELQMWDVKSGVLMQQRSLPLCDELITPAVLAAFNPAGTQLAGRSRANKKVVKCWDVETGAERMSFDGHSMPVLAVRFDTEGGRLVTCACDISHADRPHEIIVWDAASGKRLSTWTGHGLLCNAAFSPGGRWLAIGGQDGLLLLADWADSKGVVRLTGHKSHVAAVAFSPNDQLLASAGVDDRMVKIWALENLDPGREREPRKVSTLTAPALLCDLAFSPDSRRLAAISRDVVKMWDSDTHHEVLTLRGAPQRHLDPAFNPRVAFSPDGKRLVGTNWNESISMWDTGVAGDEGALARHQIARQHAAAARAVFWHLEEAEDCLEHHNATAARFHFERLGEAPLPAPLQLRKERLAMELGR